MSFVYVQEPGDPTLVMLHGTGGDEQQMLGFGHRLSNRTGFLSVLGKEPEGPVNRWFRRHAEGVFDEENLKFRAVELADFILERLPTERRIAVGTSNGANIASAMLLLKPEVIDAAALLLPMVPFQPEVMPDLTGKHVLMVCGENDPLVPRMNALSLATMLETAGAIVDLHWHPGGHTLGLVELNVIAAWVAARVAGS